MYIYIYVSTLNSWLHLFRVIFVPPLVQVNKTGHAPFLADRTSISVAAVPAHCAILVAIPFWYKVAASSSTYELLAQLVVDRFGV